MSRCIDADHLRQWILSRVFKTQLSVADVIDQIDREDAVKPEPQWIPCSETVDIPDHEVLACDLHGEMMFGYLAYEDEQWICESEQEVMYDPIAWEEKPEPYKERREE